MARLSLTDSQRTDEIAEQLLQDMALSFELLRTVNSAQVRGTQVAGNGPVLTLAPRHRAARRRRRAQRGAGAARTGPGRWTRPAPPPSAA